ncbi:MAG: hypothetical protein FWH32_06505 [Clostridiales bacterium]|nr:hypothetical protein [Clostridiales bacterium]
MKKKLFIGIGALAVAVVVALSGLPATSAVGNDIEGAFACNTSHAKLSTGSELATLSGIYSAKSNNTGVAAGAVQDTQATVYADAVNTGVASIAYFTILGQTRFSNYQVYNPSGGAGYKIPDGKLFIGKVSEDLIPIVLDISVDVDGDGSVVSKTLAEWNADNPGNKVKWESLHSEVATIDADGMITAVGKGSAVMLGTVVDKWGVSQSIAYQIVVGTPSASVEGEDGTFWQPTDKPNVWIETDEDGNLIVPPSYVFDIDETGPADPTNPSVPIVIGGGDGGGGDGGYLEQDADNPAIWHEIDSETGEGTGNIIWVGPDGKPGGGDDLVAVQDPESGEWWAHLGQNVFMQISLEEGELVGELTGGGPSEKPWETPAQPIINTNGKYFVKASDGDFYYGDKVTDGNGLLMSTSEDMHESDGIFYFDTLTGSMVIQGVIKDHLADYIDTAKGLDENDYSAESWLKSKLPSVIESAESVLYDDHASLADVKDAIHALLISMGRLEEDDESDFVVNPSYITLGKLGSQTSKVFTATNKYSGEPVEVTWSIFTEDVVYDGDEDETGTPIELKSTMDPETGELQIHVGEDANVIIVVATSVEDGKTARAFVFVVDDPDSIIAFNDLTGTNEDIGKTFMADGYTWLVLNRDAAGNLFITTTALVAATYYNTSNGAAFVPYAGSLVDIAMRNFYDTKLSLLKHYSKPAITPIEPNIGSTANMRRATTGYSYVSSEGEKTCFALSATETYQSPGFIVNPRYAASASQNDVGRRVTGFDRRFWMRSPYSNTAICRTVTGGGPASSTPRAAQIGVRPAMWINPQG